MNMIEFVRTLQRAPTGTRIVYHIGDLMYDRTTPWGGSVHATGMAAWMAMEAGKVNLVQHSTPAGFEYIAVKLPAPHKPVKWVGCYDQKRKSYTKSVREELFAEKDL